MARFALRRVAELALTLLVASFAIFASLYLAPGSPLGFLLGGRSLPPEAVAELASQYHLDEPFFARYGAWLGDVLQGDFGTSIIYQQSVASLVGPRIGTTVLLIAYAALLILIGGVGLGVVAGIVGGRVDTAVLVGTTVALAVPSFVAAVTLISIFAVNLAWFPVLGEGEGLLDRLWHLTLPAIALALASSGYIARVTRAAVREEASREHVDTGRARGLPESVVIRRHVLRNALIPVTTVGGITIAGLVAGAVVVETAFDLNGLGSYLVDAVEQKDFPVVQAIVVILVGAFVIINTLVDVLYALLDPRIEVWKRS